MLGLAEKIRNDTSIIQRTISRLNGQEIASKPLIPILESEDKIISDSMLFIDAFMEMSIAQSNGF